ncbi:RagB/SusD family nutrient uptake outer membrane protein [Sphingobacterium faecale]|uniref:RagB/SusD family nutrient uptake outer membrane protein n=1 Tax=Sphingobacterium faecale TaxID=2803775 RepID=A0ABS1R3Y9_9SPHI|nr:RagB/SusD family nutrient uptake outer membrane protein [Sphingobacterium faecale]MBL1409000.1 RagB/SusD family nutrient uptake outer membrane protein [Sphingobacterium faecale]
MKAIKLFYIELIIAMLVFFISCNRKEFLDVKPDASMTVPSTLDDYLALMDDDVAMNGAGNTQPLYPAMLEIGSDNVWIPDARYLNNIDEYARAVYNWQENPYPALDIKDWNRPYITVLNCNIVLENLHKIEKGNENSGQWDLVYGMALFHRSHAFSMLTSVFTPAYEKGTADQSAGIPLRMSADVGEKLSISSLERTYARIIEDLLKASELLPEEPIYKTRPSKRACWALLSRVYLWMQNYERSHYYADLCLEVNDQLLDYNTYSTTTNYPFPRFNEEVIFNCNMMLLTTQVRMDTSLYKSYDQNDLRRLLFFKAQSVGDGHRFYGNYDGTGYFFAGLANDELYFNRAETSLRLGYPDMALKDLNKILSSRWKKNMGISTFMPYGEMDSKALMKLILAERRKQLVWRGLRWPDLKRLNLDPEYATVLTREINSKLYQMNPNDRRYVYPVPDPVVDLNPNLYNLSN